MLSTVTAVSDTAHAAASAAAIGRRRQIAGFGCGATSTAVALPLPVGERAGVRGSMSFSSGSERPSPDARSSPLGLPKARPGGALSSPLRGVGNREGSPARIASISARVSCSGATSSSLRSRLTSCCARSSAASRPRWRAWIFNATRWRSSWVGSSATSRSAIATARSPSPAASALAHSNSNTRAAALVTRSCSRPRQASNSSMSSVRSARKAPRHNSAARASASGSVAAAIDSSSRASTTRPSGRSAMVSRSTPTRSGAT